MTDPLLDQSLWFTMGSHCPGRHYLLGNPHTFPGRMMGWCPTKRKSFFLSAADIDDASAEARAWVAGFLAGNEPRPPVGADGDVDFTSPEYLRWKARAEAFRRTGRWDPQE